MAKSLLGRTLYRKAPEGTVSGRLVEVEAYCGAADPASHAFRRRTPRNSVMFGPPGHLYVYLTYGIHHCANLVTEPEGVAGAVLLRAVEPLEGLDLMARRRGLGDPRLLARGPGRLCQAFGLSLPDNDTPPASPTLWVGSGRRREGPTLSSYRIGVDPALDRPWRFYEAGPWTSGPKNPRIPPGPPTGIG